MTLQLCWLFYQYELQFYELHINIENTVWGSLSERMLKFVMSFYGCLPSDTVQGFIKLQKSPLGDKTQSNCDIFQPGRCRAGL